MGVSVNDGHGPGRKDRLSANAWTWPRSSAAARRLAAAGITAAVLGAAACDSAVPSGPPASAGWR
jgi:hypothetical protein